jgi:hypothetical protein
MFTASLSPSMILPLPSFIRLFIYSIFILEWFRFTMPLMTSVAAPLILSPDLFRTNVAGHVGRARH